MIKALGKTEISVRGIEFGGKACVEEQQRGSNFIKIKYSVLTDSINAGTGATEPVAVSEHEATFSGQFRDEEFNEALLYFKQLVVKIVQESNHDMQKPIDEAIEKINAIEN